MLKKREKIKENQKERPVCAIAVGPQGKKRSLRAVPSEPFHAFHKSSTLMNWSSPWKLLCLALGSWQFKSSLRNCRATRVFVVFTQTLSCSLLTHKRPQLNKQSFSWLSLTNAVMLSFFLFLKSGIKCYMIIVNAHMLKNTNSI